MKDAQETQPSASSGSASPDYHRGSIDRSQREGRSERPERLYLRVLDALQGEIKRDDGNATAEHLALAAVTAICKSPRKLVKATLLTRFGATPPCAFCNYPILVAAPPSDPASLAVGRVLRGADGGRWDVNNVRPAHKLCNDARVTLEKGRTLRPGLQQRLREMHARIVAEHPPKADEPSGELNQTPSPPAPSPSPSEEGR